MRRMVTAMALGTIVGSIVSAGCTASEPLTPIAREDATAGNTTIPVHFIEDDFDGALAKASKEGKLLFVDAWAPWCHTCLSMRDEVLERPELGRFARDYVFVAVDTDRASAASFLERYRLRVWPTFFVIDPESRAAIAIHGGAASLDELSAMLEGAAVANQGGETPGNAELISAHAAYGEKRLLDAARLYEDAATKLPDARRTEALVAAIRTMWEAGEHARCVEHGEQHARAIRGSAAPSDFVLYMKECASSLPDADASKAGIAFVRKRLAELVAAPPAGASVDDRSDTMGALAEILRKDGDKPGADALETKRVAILEGAAAEAKSPVEAQTFDYARMNAYVALGRGADAVKMFEERIAQLPNSYEAHARLGSALMEIGKPKDAVRALEKAIELSYGPRRLRYMAQRAKALEAGGDLTAAIAALEAEIDGHRLLPVGQRDEKRMEEAQKRLEEARKRAPK